MKLYHKMSKFYDLKTIFNFLELLRKSGIVNMFGATPYLYSGKEFLKDEIKRHNRNRNSWSDDEDEEEDYEELINMADKVRELMILGATKRMSDDDSENYINNITRKIKKDALDILKIWSDFKGKVMNENFINEAKFDKKDAKNIIRKILIEEVNEKRDNQKLEKSVKKMIDILSKDIVFPKNFYGFMVDIMYDKKYEEKILKITTVMKKPFSQEDSDTLDEIKKDVIPKIKKFFEKMVDRVSTGGTSTLDVYNRDKENNFYF